MNLLGDTIESLDEMKDEEVLVLSINQPHLFEVILDRYQDALTRKAVSILKRREDAEDVVQETFTKIYLNAHKFKIQEGASFKSWAYKILMNTTFTKYQKIKKDRSATIAVDPEWYEVMADVKSRQFEKLEVSDYVVSVLARLPEHLGRALRLHILEGKSQEEVAEIEEISVGAVKTRVHRAKKAFRDAESAMI